MAVFWARGRALSLEETAVMAILNVTPDSFSDGGKYLEPQAALNFAKHAEAAGAKILDVGAQSTRPGAIRISPEKEWARLEPVLVPVLRETNLLVSVDTFYPEVAKQAAACGAHILNDVTGFSPAMWKIAAASGCGCIVMHPGDPEDTASHGGDILETVSAFFAEKQREAASFGIPAPRLCFDPGVGFGKSTEENLTLLANPAVLRQPGSALLIAASRKRVIAEASGKNTPPEDRLAGTLAAHTAAVLYGADIVRAHDVSEAVEAARVLDAVRARRRNPALETIRIRRLELFAYHGVNPEEKKYGQPFVLDLTLSADLSRAAETDDLAETVNYAAVRKAAAAAFTSASFDLIERAADAVCRAVLDGFPKIRRVAVEVKKPLAPMNAKFDYVSVEMTRCRK